MTIDWIEYAEVQQISKRDLDFINKKEELSIFVRDWASKDAFTNAIAERQKFPVDRELLSAQLSEQYKRVAQTAKTRENIELLKKETTFTITTAHQLSLMTGPLYYMYKIASTINLAAQLKDSYPDYDFVPVFVSGGEDHDFDEINHFRLFGKKISWDSQQAGATSQMTLIGLDMVVEELKKTFGNEYEGHIFFDKIDEFLKASDNYGQFCFALVNHLFGQYGLVCLNASSRSLKKQFSEIFKNDIFKNKSKKTVTRQIKELDKLGYRQQAFPREINTFYLGNGLRERIIKEDDRYRINNTNDSYTAEELNEIIDNYPERFSPNVVLRPMYQESILPNLAYIGGGGELAYWTERKLQFEDHDIFFPLLIRRNSALWISNSSLKGLKKLDLSVEQLFSEETALVKSFIKKSSEKNLELTNEIEQLQLIYRTIATKAKNIQGTLEKAVLAEQAKMTKGLKYIEAKLLKAEKEKFEIEINRIKKLKSSLFPNDSLQERIDNFLPIYLKYGNEYLDFVIKNLDPLKSKFAILGE